MADKKLTVRVPEDMLESLNEEAQRIGWSLSDLVRFKLSRKVPTTRDERLEDIERRLRLLEER